MRMCECSPRRAYQASLRRIIRMVSAVTSAISVHSIQANGACAAATIASRARSTALLRRSVLATLMCIARLASRSTVPARALAARIKLGALPPAHFVSARAALPVLSLTWECRAPHIHAGGFPAGSNVSGLRWGRQYAAGVRGRRTWRGAERVHVRRTAGEPARLRPAVDTAALIATGRAADARYDEVGVGRRRQSVHVPDAARRAEVGRCHGESCRDGRRRSDSQQRSHNRVAWFSHSRKCMHIRVPITALYALCRHIR